MDLADIYRRYLSGWRFMLPGALVVVVGVFAGVVIRGGFGEEPIDYNEDIRSIFNDRCINCHGGVKQEGGFSLLFREDALDTLSSGKRAIVPGRPDESELIRRITHEDPEERMPPEGEPLTGDQIDKLERWIEQGASWKTHWAYIPPDSTPVPDISDTSWAHNGIDYFIRARLEDEGLAPNPPAECHALLRRVSLDLIGLPPRPEEVDSFCSDTSPAAYEKVVDRLLASPRFGEKWASMWLDLARYADTKGYEADRHREIWRYRDWVIRAFNRDLPFDEFTVQQLAGDLLPDSEKKQLLATAFHRNTMTNAEGGTSDEEYRVAAVIDRVNTTWEVWQGTTMECVQCHSHPYDPFRHEEYFEFMSYLNNTADSDKRDERPTLPTFADTLETDVREKGRQLQASIDSMEAVIDSAATTEELVLERRAWVDSARVELSMADEPELYGVKEIPEESRIENIIQMPREERSGREQMELTRYFATIVPELEPLRQELKDLEDQLAALEPVRTPILQELPPDHARETHVFVRGNWRVQGEKVESDVPEVMPSLPDDVPNNRLGMARWLVRPDNPLTARVTVNRFWTEIFGMGIVETVSDFGTRGAAPSHPELLDWLARQFIYEHDWSVKSLLKQMVLSATYRQSSHVSPELQEEDPRNRLLARGPRVRLSAEQVRDQALAVSGLLSEKMFGPSVMPPQPPDIWKSPYNSAEWETSEGEDRYRRGLYTYWKRTAPYPSMTTFDKPSREVTVSRRIRTNTPLQALVTMNDPVYVEAARAMARRVIREAGPGVHDRITHAVKLALAHPPDSVTRQTLATLHRQAVDYYDKNPEAAEKLMNEYTMEIFPTDSLAAQMVVASAVMNLDEFIMKP
jgi:hypothetical protein